MHSLTWKLTIGLFLIVVVAIGLMIFLVDRSTSYQFQRFVSGMMGANGMMGGNMMGGGNGPNGPAAQAEFLAVTQRFLWLAGAVVVAVAVGIGMFLARQLTSQSTPLPKAPTK